MYIHGKNSIIFRINRQKSIICIFLDEHFDDQDVLALIKKAHIPIYKKNRRFFQEIAPQGAHQGIVAEIDDFSYTPLEELIVSKQQYPNIIILDGITDPHNFGAIIRTAEAIGVAGIIICNYRSVEVNSTVYKVSTGAVDNVRIARVPNLSRAIEFLKSSGFWIVGLDGSAPTDYRAIDYKMKTAIIIGSEGDGITRLVKTKCDFLVSLPMVGNVGSLNASNATAIILYYIYAMQNPLT